MGESTGAADEQGLFDNQSGRIPRTNANQQGVRDKAVAQGENFIDKAKNTAQERVRSTVATRKGQAVETVSGLAQSLLLAGQNLQDQQSPAARLVEKAAERLDQVAQYLETTEPDAVLRRAEQWARQNPALFVGGAFVVGLLGARFLKSSRPTANLPGSDGSSPYFSDREVSMSPVTEGV